jgi:hypothetical protein
VLAAANTARDAEIKAAECGNKAKPLANMVADKKSEIAQMKKKAHALV